MEEDANLVTREQYTEMLIEASLWEASEMESGFTSWCQRHIPIWRKQGYDETCVILLKVLQIRETMVLQRVEREGKGSPPHFFSF